MIQFATERINPDPSLRSTRQKTIIESFNRYSQQQELLPEDQYQGLHQFVNGQQNAINGIATNIANKTVSHSGQQYRFNEQDNGNQRPHISHLMYNGKGEKQLDEIIVPIFGEQMTIQDPLQYSRQRQYANISALSAKPDHGVIQKSTENAIQGNMYHNPFLQRNLQQTVRQYNENNSETTAPITKQRLQPRQNDKQARLQEVQEGILGDETKQRYQQQQYQQPKPVQLRIETGIFGNDIIEAITHRSIQQNKNSRQNPIFSVTDDDVVPQKIKPQNFPKQKKSRPTVEQSEKQIASGNINAVIPRKYTMSSNQELQQRGILMGKKKSVAFNDTPMVQQFSTEIPVRSMDLNKGTQQPIPITKKLPESRTKQSLEQQQSTFKRLGKGVLIPKKINQTNETVLRSDISTQQKQQQIREQPIGNINSLIEDRARAAVATPVANSFNIQFPYNNESLFDLKSGPIQEDFLIPNSVSQTDYHTQMSTQRVQQEQNVTLTQQQKPINTVDQLLEVISATKDTNNDTVQLNLHHIAAPKLETQLPKRQNFFETNSQSTVSKILDSFAPLTGLQNSELLRTAPEPIQQITNARFNDYEAQNNHNRALLESNQLLNKAIVDTNSDAINTVNGFTGTIPESITQSNKFRNELVTSHQSTLLLDRNTVQPVQITESNALKKLQRIQTKKRMGCFITQSEQPVSTAESRMASITDPTIQSNSVQPFVLVTLLDR